MSIVALDAPDFRTIRGSSTASIRRWKTSMEEIVGQDHVYVVCAIELILDLPNGLVVRATLPLAPPSGNGATIAHVMRSTGWQPHTVRGFLAAVVRKKLGLTLQSEKTDAGRVYRVVGASSSGASAGEAVRNHGRHSTDPATIEAEITRLRSLVLDALRRHWRVKFGRTPPAALSKNLLGRMIAYRLQERAFGGVDRESLKYLAGWGRHGDAPRRRLKAGTVLVRDYQGQRHTVTVVADGFNWQGTTYSSLSAIARAITRTAWSGPRFFALARASR